MASLASVLHPGAIPWVMGKTLPRRGPRGRVPAQASSHSWGAGRKGLNRIDCHLQTGQQRSSDPFRVMHFAIEIEAMLNICDVLF
jgi:hypothetical protein